MVKDNITVVDLFAGCGGMSLGFMNAGFKIVAAYDNWKPAVDTYKKNFNHPSYQRDLADLSIVPELKALNADIIISGPPCQDFSIAGDRKFKGERANLTTIFSKIIAELKPNWFVMENVYNIDKSPVFLEALNLLKDSAYGITKDVFNASYMGVPQARKRYFVIGKLGAKDNFLLDDLHNDLSKERTTVRDYLGDSLNTEYYYMHPRSYKRRAVFSIDEPSSTIRGVNRPIPKNYFPHNADKTKNLTEVRALTSNERSYIQTFPSSFTFCGTQSSIEKMIGNAVPVKMAEYIAKHIYSRLQRK